MSAEEAARSDLTDAIEAFLVKYPPDAALEWRDEAHGPRTATRPALAAMTADLVSAAERARRRAGHTSGGAA